MPTLGDVTRCKEFSNTVRIESVKNGKKSAETIVNEYPKKEIVLTKKKNTISLNQRYLTPELFTKYSKYRLLAVQSEKGTGKTSNLIESYFKNQPHLAKDSVIDYFINLAEAEEMPYMKINRFVKIYDEPSRRSFIKSWISATKRHLILTELRDLEGLDKLEETTDYLLELSFRIL